MSELEIKMARVEEKVEALREDVKEIKESLDFLTRRFVERGFTPPRLPSPSGVDVGDLSKLF